MRCQVGKKHLLFTYMAIMFSLMDVIFNHIGTIVFVQPIISCHIGTILCHTSTTFCGMPIISFVIFRIHSVMLSICCVMGTISSVYSNYSLCDIHYFQCCALNFLSVVHYSASTQYNFKVILSPLKFPVSQQRYSFSCSQNFL